MYIKIKPKQSNPLKLIYLLIFSIGLFSACKKEPNTSFYYWKTQYSISPYEQNYLDSLNVEKLYVRFFDVDIKNGNAVPIGNLIVHEKNKKQANPAAAATTDDKGWKPTKGDTRNPLVT